MVKQLVLLVLLGLAALVAASDVTVLTADTFQTTLDENEFVMVEFYAPWCGHCKNLAPIYEEVATELVDEIIVANVDCDAEKDLCGEYGVRGFPTLKFFRSGTPVDYQGGRTKDAIVGWLKKKTGPATTVLATAEEVADFVMEKTPVLVGYFSETEGDNYEAFKSAANSVDDYSFGEVNDAAAFDGAEDGTVVFYRGSIGPNKAFAFGDDEDLVSFITTASLPLVGEVTPENYAKYAANGVMLQLAFVDLADEEQKSAVVAAMEAVAEDFVGTFTYGYIDGQKFLQQAKKMGASGEKLPTILAIDFEGGKNILLDEALEITADSVKTFSEGIVSGEIAYKPKSDPIPEDNDGPVTILVGKNFDEIVMDDTKDVLVEFYAPWCGHCKSLAPIYDQLGEKFAGVDSIVIAKVDATTNDTPESIRGYPTIKFYSATNKTPVDYEGARDLDGFVAYLKENAAIAFDLDAEPAKEEESKDEL